MNYKMVVEIPITDVPDNISIQEAKVTAEIWLKLKVDDAVMVEFKGENESKSRVISGR